MKKIIEGLRLTFMENEIVLPAGNLQKICCKAAFLRGVFLACGSISSPERGYRLEFLPPHPGKTAFLRETLEGNDFFLKQSIRAGRPLFYTKDSEVVEDILTFLGAGNVSLEIMNAKIEKDVSNNLNRIINCSSANYGKTMAASIRQTAAIEKLQASGRLSTLPGDLQKVADLRLQNPELSLSELAKQSGTSLSRAGLCRRLACLEALAEEK